MLNTMTLSLMSTVLPLLRSRCLLAATGVGVALTVGGCQRPKASSSGPPVAARVGESVILVSDVQEEISRRVKRGNLVPAKETLLDDMVQRRLLVDQARQAGLDKDPELMRSWENLLISRYKEEHLRKETRQVSVSEEEIRLRYEGSPDKFRRAAKARLAILQVSLPTSLSREDREAKIEAMAQARTKTLAVPAGAGFGALAVEHSEDDVTRHRGGDAGWLDEGVDYRWPDAVVRAGFALAVGAVSEPIEVDGAVFLVKKSDERPSTMLAFEAVRERLRKEIHTEKLRTIEAAFAGQLRTGVTIETFPESLRELEIPIPDHRTIASEEPPPDIP